MRYRLFILLFAIIMQIKLTAQDLVVTQNNDSLNCEITNEDDSLITITLYENQSSTDTAYSIDDILYYQYNHFRAIEIMTAKKLSKDNYDKFNFSINIGYGYRIAPLSQGLDDEIRSHIKKLKSGLAFSAEIAYYIKENMGVGMKYRQFNASQTSYVRISQGRGMPALLGILSSRHRIIFVGPSYETRFFSYTLRNVFSASVTPGFLHYRDIGVFDNSFEEKLTGITLGILYEMSASFKIHERVFLEIELAYLSANLSKFRSSANGETKKIELVENAKEGLSRIDASFGIKVDF